MDTRTIEILERNVRQLSRQTEQETRMMPQTEASLTGKENHQSDKKHHLPRLLQQAAVP